MKILAMLSIAAALLVGAPARTEMKSTPDEETTEAARAEREPLKLPLASPRVVVSKGKRRLDLYSGGRVVRTYRVALGKNASEDKERQGDCRTPEGEFYVCVKNAASKFYLSLGLSYPNREDAERGLRDRLITRGQYERIVAAIGKGLRPPWDTALGGEIFIHGGGSGSDWTWGCVALDDADVKELFDAVPKGTQVVIEH
ncbi:MAG TPA: L,D-transpeptidase [Pyrinomonadaceae bacterium]|jgi:murein L,D-transpeptidase YafK